MKKLVFIFSIITIISCTKEEECWKHPPDNTIETFTIETYITKLYISTIGREPTVDELDTNFKTLRETDLSQESRELVITEILNKAEYSDNLFTVESVNILNGLGEDHINDAIDGLLSGSELQRMEDLQAVLPGLKDGTISVIEMHKRMVNNSFYDEINMGHSHFVISVFENFIQRTPGFEERQNGINMLKNVEALLFLQPGNSKDDFIDIFFESDAYFTGQTNTLFNRYLFRNPTSEESVNYSLDYINTRTIEGYKELQKRILSTDEFIGL